MSTIALVNPLTLIGKEVREALERRGGDHEVRLLTTDPEGHGTVTELGGAAALVSALDADGLAGVDLALLCGDLAAAPELPAGLPPGATAVRLAGTGSVEPEGPAFVAGVNLERLADRLAGDGGPHLAVSPHPAVVTLAHLLHPLATLASLEAAATVVLPVSLEGQEGLDELFEQTRSLLTFQPIAAREVLGHQRAFNLLAGGSRGLARQLGEVVPGAGHLAVQPLLGGIFHGVSASVHVTFGDDPGRDAVEAALAGHPDLELVAEPADLGPVDAASRSELLVGAVEADPDRVGAYWLWAVMDNLTRGGADNALAIADVLLEG